VNVWSPHVASNAQWIIKNILGGLFGAVLEALPEVTVTDLVRIFDLNFKTLFLFFHSSTSHTNEVNTWAYMP
jgi:hypothetical protein